MDFNISTYQLFLFDLDGLLIDTEKVHWQAYCCAAKEWGVSLNWDYETYCNNALKQSNGVKKAIEEGEPQMKPCLDDWDNYYKRKSALVAEILQNDPIDLMPGVEELLLWLQHHGKKCCVVTHSKKEFVDIVRKKQPVLNLIPNWLTREDYQSPKPSPDGYLTAIKRFGEEGDKVAGFEDSPRGLTSLMHTPAQPFFVTCYSYDKLPEWKQNGVIHINTLESLITIE